MHWKRCYYIIVYTLHVLQKQHNNVVCCWHTGAFGKVFEGVFNDPDKNIVDVTVAIKTIKSM